MNERIKELCIEAGASILPGSTGVFINALDPQKFAELIIKECIEICTSGDIEKPMGNYYAKQIEKRFGIKKYNKTIYDEISWRMDEDRE